MDVGFFNIGGCKNPPPPKSSNTPFLIAVAVLWTLLMLAAGYFLCAKAGVIQAQDETCCSFLGFDIDFL